MEHSQTLPYASSLCGACYEVCPVKINIPEILIHLRNKLVEKAIVPAVERMGMKAAAWAMSDAANLSTARAFGRIGQMAFTNNGMIHHLPGMMSEWTSTRDMPAIPAESFRQWWANVQTGETAVNPSRRPRETRTPSRKIHGRSAIIGDARDEYAAIARDYRRTAESCARR